MKNTKSEVLGTILSASALLEKTFAGLPNDDEIRKAKFYLYKILENVNKLEEK